MERCEQCGFVYADVRASAISEVLQKQPERYSLAIAGDPAKRRMRVRPAPAVWSALEYLCHVRDVLQVQHDRLQLALRESVPTFAPMGRDERVVTDRYNEQDPAVVLTELGEACHRLADAFERLEPPQWERTGIYNWPSPTPRTMLWLAQHTIHELVHHLQDITAVLSGSEPGRGSRQSR